MQNIIFLLDTVRIKLFFFFVCEVYITCESVQVDLINKKNMQLYREKILICSFFFFTLLQCKSVMLLRNLYNIKKRVALHQKINFRNIMTDFCFALDSSYGEVY